jgi:pimeloyl-ACP methyl ester carboxylesterase
MSLATPRRLLIFVHGLNGRNTATWIKFPGLLLDDPRQAFDDLLFYGYDSLFQSGIASGEELYKKCDKLISDPSRYVPSSKEHRRAANFTYESIVFIGHSLGAPVIRSMLLQAQAKNRQWLKNVTLTFFAPATAGARAEEALRFLAMRNDLFNFFWTPFYLRCPVIEDMKIGSAFLTYIQNETVRLLQHHPNFRSALTVFGRSEWVVAVTPPRPEFDEPYTWIKGHTHRTVCKPVDEGDCRYKVLADVLEGL